MIKPILWFMLGLFTQIIAIIMWGEFVWLYLLANGGVGGNPLGYVQPIFWVLIIIEIVLFVVIVSILKKKKE